MAIITDATGRQLAQAVGGIDTGGLVKDTTLQATNTALGNINTSEQAIASAIAGLGQSLGNDKANISGDNIGNKSTFRNNIEASGIAYEWFTKDNLGTLVSQTDYSITFNVTKTGYTPLGIVTVRLNNNYSTRFHLSQWYISGNTAYVVIRASESGVSSNNLNVGIGVLYANTTF